MVALQPSTSNASDVFLSYKSEDREEVRRLREALSAQQLNVTWDQDIPGGESWSDAIQRQVETAACVVVVWSARSAGPGGDFVRDEARRAKARGVLVPVRIDGSPLPLGFGELQTLDLEGWDGASTDLRFQDVSAAVRARIDGRSAPVPRWPQVRRRRRIAWSTGGGVALVLATAFAFHPAPIRRVCLVPGVRQACQALDIGHVPGAEEEKAWTLALASDETEPLMAYLGRYPEGAFADVARNRLAACTRVMSESVRMEIKELPLHVSRLENPSPTEARAREEAVAVSARDANVVCKPFSKLFELLDATARAEDWQCERREAGFVCGFSGAALCQVRVRERVERDVCR